MRFIDKRVITLFDEDLANKVASLTLPNLYKTEAFVFYNLEIPLRVILDFDWVLFDYFRDIFKKKGLYYAGYEIMS